MELLYFFEKIRLPGLNEFMLTITTLGEETAFLVIALICSGVWTNIWGTIPCLLASLVRSSTNS